MLDSLLDRREDRRSGQRGYLERYPAGSQEMADRLAAVIRAALSEGARMRGGAHHLMTLAGLLAYYCSALGSTGAAEQVLRARMHAELGPLLSAPMAVMRGWRAARAGHRAAPCIVSRSQLSAPRPVPACSGGSRETEVPGFDGKPLGEVGS